MRQVMEKMIEITGILGSPRKDGASARLLNIMANEFNIIENNEVNFEIIRLCEKDIQHCTGCDVCLKADCPLDDSDDYPEIQARLVKSDAIVIASPVYFLNVPGILKDFIDRSRRMKMNRNMLQGKLLGVLVASGLRNGGGETVANLLYGWGISQGMLPIGGLGHPILENPIAISTLQGDGLKKFRNPADGDEIGDKGAIRLAQRIYSFLK